MAPAVASLGAYANAKFGVWSDLQFISRLVGYTRTLASIEKQDRTNVFYLLESNAKDPTIADNTFLLLPPDATKPNDKSAWTYAEAYENILQYAAWLREEHKIEKDEVVAMDFTNKPQFLWLWFALWSLGARPAFINTNLRDNAFTHCVKVSTARMIFVDPSVREVLNEQTQSELAGQGIAAVVLEEDTEQAIHKKTPYRAPNEARSGKKLKESALLICKPLVPHERPSPW